MTTDESAHAADFLDLIRSRRTIVDFEPRPLPREELLGVLDLARWAPNHKLTEPWRFTILGPATREAMADVWPNYAESKLDAGATDERRQQVRTAAREKWLSKPAIVAVRQVVDSDPFRAEEDYAAVCCAIQNVQLAAWARGIGCQWSTNGATRDPEVQRHVGVREDERVVGFLFLGYPATIPETRRQPLDAVLTVLP